MNQDFIVTDGRTLPPEILKEKQVKALRSEIQVYKNNLSDAEKVLATKMFVFFDATVDRVRRHARRLRETIAEKTEELNRLCTH